MLVKAKGNFKDARGWHFSGEIFETDDPWSMMDLVELLEQNAPKSVPKAEKKEEAEPEKTAEPEQAKPKTSRRKKTAE